MAESLQLETPKPQRIFFDGEMRPIEQVFAVMLEGGYTETDILRSFEFTLGVGRYASTEGAW